MHRSKKRVAIIGAFAVLLAGFAAASSAPSASGQSGGSIEAGSLSGPVVPVAGWSGEAASQSPAEAGFHATAVTPSDAPPAEAGVAAESVIGPDGRVQVSNTTGTTNANPSFAIGQIEFTQNGQEFICTGWLIDANSILSAGHCAYGQNDIIEQATWFPGRNGAVDPGPVGGCPVVAVWAPPVEWVQNQQPYYDFSVMNFANPGVCQDIEATTGSFGLYATSALNGLNNAQVVVQGYPGDKPFGTHWKMAGRIAKGNKRFVFYPMDTFGGQSGSPVWHNRPNSAAACHGACGYAIHAYGVGLPGFGATNNGGPRLTAFRLGQIRDFAGQNGT